jgi:hypothetical protein
MVSSKSGSIYLDAGWLQSGNRAWKMLQAFPPGRGDSEQAEQSPAQRQKNLFDATPVLGTLAETAKSPLFNVFNSNQARRFAGTSFDDTHGMSHGGHAARPLFGRMER